ncbi:hypothetical protein Tco_0348565 [Tanacetum coccineum]
MKGTVMTKQEHESMLYDEFDKFTFEPEESIHSYYLRYAKLINDIKMIPMSMSNMQINTKFMNHLQPEWSRFVTAAKQARDLHVVNFDQFYAPPVFQQPPTLQPDTRFAVLTFLPTDNPIASLSKAMIFLSSAYSSRYPPTNNQLQASSNPRTQATIQNGQVTIQNVQAIANFKANHVDAYDSDCDDKATTNAIFMENFAPFGSINGDTVEPRNNSNILFEVLKNLNSAKGLLSKFDDCIKRRTMLPPHQIGSWEQLNIKGAFKKDVIPFFENLKETFKLFENGFIAEVKEMKDIFEQMEDEENIASDIMCTYLRSLNEVDNCGKCKSLDIVILDLQESNKSLCELRKHFAKLEEYNFTLDIAFQNHKEQMILNDPEMNNK